MPKLMCYSYSGFKKELENNGWRDGNLPSDWVFVSIGEFAQLEDEPHLLSECDQVINLNFDDISGYRMWDALPDFAWTPATKEVYKDNYGMSETDANRLFDFLNANIGKNVMVHCSAGVSRSQGVVRFLLDCYPDVYTDKDTNQNNPCRIPNIYVTAMLKRSFYMKNGLIEN